MDKKTIYLENNGCRKNMLIGELFKAYSAENNYEIVGDPRIADILVVNTCAFDRDAENRSILDIKTAHTKKKGGSHVIVTGCLPAINPARMREYHGGPSFSQKDYRGIEEFIEPINSGIDSIKKPATISFPSILFRAKKRYERDGSMVKVIKYLAQSSIEYLLGTSHRGGEFYSADTYVMKINDGCLNKCTFCAIPFSVGGLRSRPLEELVGEFKAALDNGHKRIALVSDDSGVYGKDRNQSLSKLLDPLFSFNGDYTVSVGNLNPRWFIKDYSHLRQFLISSHLGYLSLPVQSGNDRILKLMGRMHEIAPFIDYVLDIKESAPHLHLTTQVIVGFPTETDKEFRDTYNIVRKLQFSSVDVSKYTERPNTPGERIEPKVDQYTKEERHKSLQRLLRRIAIKKILRR